MSDIAESETQQTERANRKHAGQHEFLSGNEVRCQADTPLNARNLEMIPGNVKCQLESCTKPALISLESLGLCVEHFLSACYERLDHLEPKIRRRTLEESNIRAAYALLEECSDRALFVALQQEHLTNLDRSRLLNILLLTRHLQLLLKNTGGMAVDSLPHASAVLSGSGSREK